MSVRTSEEFINWVNSNPKKFDIKSWIPREHWEYWVIKWKYNAVNNQKDKNYYAGKLCNFIHKPMIDAFKQLRKDNG